MTVTYNPSRRTLIRNTIQNLVSYNFSSTLGREKDIVNIVNAMIYLESKYNANAVGPQVSYRLGTGGAAYLQSSSVSSVISTGDSAKIANIFKGLTALGIMQVMGWNIVKGAGPTGQSEIERLRPDLTSSLIVNPGDDPYLIILGENNFINAIMAGLIILEGKYKTVNQVPAGFVVKGDPYNRIFSSKISGAIAAYLGLGSSDLNGTTPEAYVASIIGGNSYIIANGSSPIGYSDSNSNLIASNGPGTNGSGLNRIGIAGCSA